MSELLEAAKAVIDAFDDNVSISDCELIDRLRNAVRRIENAPDFPTWWERDYGGRTCRGCAEDAWKTAQQAERERIRSRMQIAKEKTWKAGDWYIGPQHNNIEAFVEELLREDDDT